jgi:hypothetical protein
MAMYVFLSNRVFHSCKDRSLNILMETTKDIVRRTTAWKLGRKTHRHYPPSATTSGGEMLADDIRGERPPSLLEWGN